MLTPFNPLSHRGGLAIDHEGFEVGPDRYVAELVVETVGVDGDGGQGPLLAYRRRREY